MHCYQAREPISGHADAGLLKISATDLPWPSGPRVKLKDAELVGSWGQPGAKPSLPSTIVSAPIQRLSWAKKGQKTKSAN